MDFFDAAFALVASIEGGYVNDPSDPGGATKFGLSARAYPALDIANLTLDEAKAIYRRDYWDKNCCGAMPWPFALALFDGAVNQGQVVPLLQRALGAAEDGIVGKATLAALAHANEEHLHEFLALRAARYVKTRGFEAYGRGWLRRLFRVAQAGARAPQ